MLPSKKAKEEAEAGEAKDTAMTEAEAAAQAAAKGVANKNMKAVKASAAEIVAQSPMHKMAVGKEYLIKWKGRSYWHCEWIGEGQLLFWLLCQEYAVRGLGSAGEALDPAIVLELLALANSRAELHRSRDGLHVSQ